ncbi:MAG: dual specificity protein phosphatase family protein [Alphaproteobacteria bacterium]|nr:dual specificity protein phosphatase family protein [Alphaproteobacteria bacterium]
MSSYLLTWCPVSGGHLAIGHKPGKRLRKQLEEESCTLVVNLLSEKESRASESAQRVRFRLQSADPPGSERDAEARALFTRMRDELQQGGRVYLHCSAGLHRTGMVAYGFLRSLGRPPEEAVALIREMRALTADALTEERMGWGEGFVLSQ